LFSKEAKQESLPWNQVSAAQEREEYSTLDYLAKGCIILGLREEGHIRQ
jgi:hypothetical protein